MSVGRMATPLASSFLPVIRNPISRTPSSLVCSQCLRRLAPPQTYNTRNARRFLATATAERPNTFEPQAPPRNSGIPDTSIAGEHPRVDQTSGNSIRAASTTKRLPETEAQKPQPANADNTAVGSVASTSSKARKSKLRPRKAAMTLTPNAVTALRELLNQPEPKLIRVGVKNRGCSGLAYHLEYVDKPNTFDEAVDQDGVKVLIDSKALFSIIGSEMDWIEDKLSRRFVFKNPNITEQCGCGESFSIG